MPYTRTSTKKLHFIENMILITFPIVLFAGCAGGDIKPELKEPTLATYSDYENPLPESDLNDVSTVFPNIESEQPEVSEETRNEETKVAGYDNAPYLPVNDSELTEAIEKSDNIDSDDQQNTASAIYTNNSLTSLPTQNTFFFDTDKHLLEQEQRKLLEQHADFLIANPTATLVISGHADIRGSEDYNQDLSEKRANAVHKTLVGLGVPQSQLVIQAFGELQPMHDENNWYENRRVELEYADPVVISSR